MTTAAAYANQPSDDAAFAAELSSLRDTLDWSENHQPLTPTAAATSRRHKLLAAAAFCATMCWTMALTMH